MRILVTHPSAELYGSDRMVSLAIEALTGKGHQVKAVLPKDGPLVGLVAESKACVVISDIPVLRRADLHPLRIFALLWQLAQSAGHMLRIIRTEQPEAVYVNTIVQPWWILAGKLMRRRVVVHVREAEGQSRPAVRKLLYGCLLLADLVICNSEATRAEILSMIPLRRDRTTVIYNGKDWSNYRVDRTGRPRRHPRRDTTELTVVGRLSHRKGQDIAIRALAELVGLGYPARLTLVGNVFEGNESFWSELIGLARQLDVLDRTRLVGFRSDIRPILEETDIAIVPSRIEPFGTVAAESMAAGVLTVVAEVQGLTEIVVADHNGLTFTAGDHAQLAARCVWALTHPAEAAEIASRGQCDVEERFGVERYHREIVEALESVDRHVRAELERTVQK